MSTVATWIASILSNRKLSHGHRAVLKVIAKDPQTASYCSTQRLADMADVNVATVVRTAQAIGFTGWTALSNEVRNRFLSSLGGRTLYEHNLDRQQGTALQSIAKDLELMQLLQETVDEVVIHSIAEKIALSKSTLILTTGSYTAPGALLAHNCQLIGYDVTLNTGALTSMINQLRLLQPGDCLVTFSIWKFSSQILQLCTIAQSRGINIIVIADRHSTVAELADELIVIPSESTGPMPSVTCCISVVQSIFAAIADFDQDYAQSSLEEIDNLWSVTSAVLDD